MDNQDTYIFDFETTPESQYIEQGEVKVWLWYMRNTAKTNDAIGLTMDEFFQQVYKLPRKSLLKAHNLSGFDGWFVLDYAIRNEWIYSSKLSKDKQYNWIMDDKKKIYMIRMRFGKNNHTFLCSYLQLMSGVSQIEKEFKQEEDGYMKEDIDYDAHHNEENLEDIDPKEIEYIKNDVNVVIDAINSYDELIPQDKQSITLSATTYKHYMDFMEEEKGKIFLMFSFPWIDSDDWLELSKWYRGGFTYLNPKWKQKEINQAVSSYDVNSLYPSVMSNYALPYGKWIVGDTDNPFYNFKLYKVVIEKAIIKDGYIPFITKEQSFGSNIVEDSIENSVKYLSTPELKVFEKYYQGKWDLIVEYSFRTRTDMFDKWLDIWYGIKEQAKKDMNGYTYLLSKLHMNALYGKFGQRPNRLSKELKPHNDDFNAYDVVFDDMKLVNVESETRPKYIPVAIGITAFSRTILWEAIQDNAKNFVYCDTDSLHILGKENEVNGIELDANELGKWDFEGTYKKSFYIKKKQYYHQFEDGTEEKKVASLNKKFHKDLTYQQMKNNETIKDGKLGRKNVKGGIILKKADFTFRN